MKLVVLIAIPLLAAFAGAAQAQSAGDGGAALEIHHGLNVSTIRPLRVQLQADGATLGITAIELRDGPALVEVTGDANRIYRIQVMDIGEGDARLDIISANAGNISRTGIGVMDAKGHDLLHISGDPAAFRRYISDTGQIPLNIQYE